MGSGASQPASTYAEGDTFARRYVVEELLGSGFQAEVYAVRNKHTGALRALKLLKARHRGNEEYVKRFLQEAEQLTRLDHPNLVRVYDAGIEDTGEVWMLMELLEGLSLRKLKQSLGALSSPLATFLVRDVCRAIAAAHAHEIMHRDVKPENVMVTPDGVRVLDFGIAKVYGSAVPTTDRRLRTLGTIAYMAPEQVASLPPDRSVDVYAAGVVLYELIAGRHPFHDVLHDAMEVGKRHMFQTPPRLDEVAIGVPDDITRLVAAAMAKDRSHRPAMAELSESLERALERFEAEVRSGRAFFRPPEAELPVWERLLADSPLHPAGDAARAGASVATGAAGLPASATNVDGPNEGPHGTTPLTAAQVAALAATPKTTPMPVVSKPTPSPSPPKTTPMPVVTTPARVPASPPAARAPEPTAHPPFARGGAEGGSPRGVRVRTLALLLGVAAPLTSLGTWVTLENREPAVGRTAPVEERNGAAVAPSDTDDESGQAAPRPESREPPSAATTVPTAAATTSASAKSATTTAPPKAPTGRWVKPPPKPASTGRIY